MGHRFKRSLGDRVFDIFNAAILVTLTVVTVYPMYHVLMASLSNSFDLMAHRGFLLVPIRTNFNAYMHVIRNPSIFSGYRNTLIVLSAGTAVNMILTCMGGVYSLSETICHPGVSYGADRFYHVLFRRPYTAVFAGIKCP